MLGRHDHLFLRKEDRLLRSRAMPDPDAWYVHALLEEENNQGELQTGTEDPVELALPDGRRLFYLATVTPQDSAASTASQTVAAAGEGLNAASGLTIRAFLTEIRTILPTDAKDRLDACSEGLMQPLGRPVKPVAAAGQGVYVRVWLPNVGGIPLRAADFENALASRIASHLGELERTERLDHRAGCPVLLKLAALPGTFYYACWERGDPNSEHRKYNEFRVVRVDADPAPWLGDISRLIANIRVPTSPEEIEKGGWKSVQVGADQGQAVSAVPRQPSTRHATKPATSEIEGKDLAEKRTTRGPGMWAVVLLALLSLAGVALIYSWPEPRPDGDNTPHTPIHSTKNRSDRIPDSVVRNWEKFHQDMGESLAQVTDFHRPDDLMRRLAERIQRPVLESEVKWEDSTQRKLFIDFQYRKDRPRNLYLDFVERLPSKDNLPTPHPWPRDTPTQGPELARYYRVELGRVRGVLKQLEDRLGLPEEAQTDWSSWEDPDTLWPALKRYLTFYAFEDRVKNLPVYADHDSTDTRYSWQSPVKRYLNDRYAP